MQYAIVFSLVIWVTISQLSWALTQEEKIKKLKQSWKHAEEKCQRCQARLDNEKVHAHAGSMTSCDESAVSCGHTDCKICLTNNNKMKEVFATFDN